MDRSTDESTDHPEDHEDDIPNPLDTEDTPDDTEEETDENDGFDDLDEEDIAQDIGGGFGPDRSSRLFADGFRAERLDDYTIEINTPTGETFEIDTLFQTCGCPLYQRTHGLQGCEHLRGYERLLADQEQDRQERAGQQEQEIQEVLYAFEIERRMRKS